LIPVLKY